MTFLHLIIHQIKEVPDYLMALKGAVAVLAMGFPIYTGLRYFLYRRHLKAPLNLTLNFIGVFVLYAGLAFLLASPLANHMVGVVVTSYLLVTCIVTALAIVALIDLFLVQHYLSHAKKMYVSPPLRTVIKLCVFCISVLPILRFVLHFNPLTVIAIPTIVTAGIAFALQDSLKAFIAGIGLGNLVRIGEWISFHDKEGRVADINWARTTLETTDGQRIYIPNSLLLTGIFSNYTSGNPTNRLSLKISASYDASPTQVKEALLTCAQFVSGVATSPAPQVALLDYGDSGIVYGLYYWIDDYSRRLQIQDEVSSRAWYTFRRENISIPYPTRQVYLQRSKSAASGSQRFIEESLRRWSLAEAFYSEELQELSHWTKSRSYGPGEIIVRQGDSGQSLFVIVDGQVDVYADSGLSRVVASLGTRDIFGEMSLLTGEPRSATVRAKTQVDTLEIQKNGLQKVIAKRPEISEHLAELIARRQTVLAAASSSDQASKPKENDSSQSLSRQIRQFFGL